MGDLRAKSRVRGDAVGGDTSSAAAASRMIIAQWSARRRQACEQMVLDLDRRDRDSELLALARLHAVSTMLDASSFLRAHDEDDGGSRDAGGRRDRSPERALVRRIAREWTAPPQSSPRNGAEEWLGETERERVRSVRERVRRASQGDGDDAHTEQSAMREPRLRGRQTRADVATRMAMERQRELQGLSEHRAVSAFAHRGHIQSFLRGRFFRNGRPMHDERPFSMAARELGQLGQSLPVTRLREEVRSRTENFTNDEATNRAGSVGAQNSSANTEHHRFMDRVFLDDNYHLVNAAHDHEIQMFQSPGDNYVDVESTVPNSNNNVLRDDLDQEHMHGYEEYSDSGSSEQGSEQSGSSSSSPSDNSVRQEAQTYGQQPTDLQWSRVISISEDGEGGTFLHRDEEWHVIDSQEAGPQWQSGPSFSSSRNINRFNPPDDDVYGVELRELLSRRSVSNLLSSGFRESLDQLIQSYAQRQEHDPLDWNYERQIPATDLLNQDHAERGINELSQAEHDTTPQPSIVLSGQALLQQHRHWQNELPHHSWSQQTMQRPEFDCDAIHILRDDLTGLQRGMTGMQQMLEACMEMQIELQRSIKQEVSAALNRSISTQGAGEEDDGSQWKLARKGTCCICCDNQIDSLLYRCGHMCTCSKCASELLQGVGKCPLCRAPIVEVIRAYCIM